MISVKGLLMPFVAFLLVIGLSLGQGPKKDIGANVPLPPETNDDNKPPQKPETLPRTDTLKLDVDLVNVEVTVTGSDGHPITDLTKGQFRVFDDNVQQQITNFSLTDEPLTIAILMEYSGSLRPYNKVFLPALGLIDSLRTDDWCALIAYNRRQAFVTDFTKNKNDLHNGLNLLGPPQDPESRLYDAVYETLNRMEGIDGKKAIFLLSSGLDTGDNTEHSYLDALKKTEASDTPIYAISMAHMGMMLSDFSMGGGIGGNRILQADNALGSFADNGGGSAFFPRFAQEYPSIYQTVRAQLQNQYSLGFAPANRKADGKFHRLRVEVGPLDQNHDGRPDKIKIRHKQGYYAARS